MMIQLLVGMIASGKSTYARERADAGASIICHDDLTEMIHGRYRYEQALRDYYRASEDSLVVVAFNFDKDVVIDRTHLTRESRHRWVSVAGLLGVKIEAVVFPVSTSTVHAMRRFEADPRGRSLEDWLAVARHHCAQWKAEPIDPSEGFDRIVYREALE